jgi:hypothetical protein
MVCAAAAGRREPGALAGAGHDGRGRGSGGSSQDVPGDIVGGVLARLNRRLDCLLLVVALLMTGCVCAPAAPAASVGGGSAFSELTEGGKAATETTASTASTGSSGSSSTASSSSSTVLLLGVIAAGALIAGIAFLIMRDAHRVAPVSDGQAIGRSGRDPAATMRKRRAKAKAARRQRKRNR